MQLQASPLTNTGLIESLKRACDVLAFRTGADVQFTAAPTLPPEAAFAPGAHQAMLRFAQEALANVARHARASHVTVSLQRRQSLIVLAVSDDGQGSTSGSRRRGWACTAWRRERLKPRGPTP
jgi:signal transduction histidine kinase